MNKIFTLLLAGLCLFACKKEDETVDGNFDRAGMLRNYAENLIIPSYTDLQTSLGELKIAADSFNATTNEENLNTLRQKWVNAYTAWQYCTGYNFGPAAANGLLRSLNEEIATFPVSEIKIESAILDPDFNDFNRDARGFLAVEYLIYGKTGNDSDLIAGFDQNRKNYLTGAVNDIITRVNAVVTGWNTGYKEEFTANNGTNVGSSTSQFYNEFLRSFEANKNFKLELPLGMRPGQTTPAPEQVEAYYSGLSIPMIRENLIAIEYIYYGKNKAGVKTGPGWIDYVGSVEGGSNLVASTVEQWQKVKDAAADLSTGTTMAQQVQGDASKIEKLREELQRQTRFFKSDMSSILGIAITYSSGDGD